MKAVTEYGRTSSKRSSLQTIEKKNLGKLKNWLLIFVNSHACNLPCEKFIGIVILWGLLHHPIWLYLVLALLGITVHLLNYIVWIRITDEGRIPEMRIWSILLIKSDLKWCIHLSRRLFLNFNFMVSCHCWWTKESPRAHVAKFYGRLRLIGSV